MPPAPPSQPGPSDDFGYGPHDWERLGANGASSAREPGDTARSEFQRDYDRLVFSGAYRRLAGKTQVVSPGEADFFRNRLTHTIEVSQVARRLAEALNTLALQSSGPDEGEQLTEMCGPRGCIDPDVCAAASALHDLGHPPFGHAGEQELARAVERQAVVWGLCGKEDASQVSGSFNGNAQSLRMAVHSLTHKPPRGGLQLTRAVLDGMIKYPWRCGEGPKEGGPWSVYPSESKEFAWIREGVPSACSAAKSVEAQIVDWADDIAYAVHDVEDWYRAGVFPLDQLTDPDSPALHALCEEVERRWDDPGAPEFVRHVLASDEGGFAAFRSEELRKGPTIDPHGREGREAMRRTRSALYNECFLTTSIGLQPEAGPDWPHRHALELRIDVEVRRKNKLLRDLLGIYLVGKHALTTQQNGQRTIVRTLFELHAAAADPENEDVSPQIFPGGVREEIEERSLDRLRLVADSVAGMTDVYALRLHARLTGQGSPFQEFI